MIRGLKFKDEPPYDDIKIIIKRAIHEIPLGARKFDWVALDPAVIAEISAVPLEMPDDIYLLTDWGSGDGDCCTVA